MTRVKLGIQPHHLFSGCISTSESQKTSIQASHRIETLQIVLWAEHRQTSLERIDRCLVDDQSRQEEVGEVKSKQ